LFFSFLLLRSAFSATGATGRNGKVNLISEAAGISSGSASSSGFAYGTVTKPATLPALLLLICHAISFIWL
jgi:hypothetical protein